MKIACIGVGTIGRSWIALFLGKGYEVSAWDPAAGWQAGLQDGLQSTQAILQSLGYAHAGDQSNLRIAPTLEAAVAGADYVQENAPENLELKTGLLRKIEAYAPQHAIIASSTSGLLPSKLAAKLEHPDRFVVAHPYDPPHIIPLVEVVPSASTDPANVATVVRLLRALQKAPLVMNQEVAGFIGVRLQTALVREAFHMLVAGEATAEQIDFAVRNGPGLRWPFAGPCENEADWILPEGQSDIHVDRYNALMTSDWTRMPPLELSDQVKQVLEAELPKALAKSLAPDDASYEAMIISVLNALKTPEF